MWSATEPKVYPEISTHFYPCMGGLFGKQSDKWLNVLDNFDNIDIENKFGTVFVQDDNGNTASFISSDNRHFHGAAYPLKTKVFKCGSEVEPDLPHPVIGVGFQREELIVVCLVSPHEIGFFQLQETDNYNKIEEWVRVGTLFNQEHFFFNHVYFSKDGTKAVTILTKKEKITENLDDIEINVPYLLEINIGYYGSVSSEIKENETTRESSLVAPYTLKLEIDAPFAAEYVDNELKVFKVKIEFISGVYPRKIYYPPVEEIPYWSANYYYAYWNPITGEHWKVPHLYWWQVGATSYPGLSIESYPTKGSNEIEVTGGFQSYKIHYNGLERDKSIYTTQGLDVTSSIIYSTTGNPGYPDAPFFGPLAKVDLKAIVPRIPSFLDGLFEGKHFGVTAYFLAGSIYSKYSTGISTKTYSYNISDYTTSGWAFYDGSGIYNKENEIMINAQGSLINSLHDKFIPRDSKLGTGVSTREVLLLVDLSLNLFVIAGILGVRIVKDGEIIKTYENSLLVSKNDAFEVNAFDGEKDGVWGNIGIKYSSQRKENDDKEIEENYLIQFGDNNAMLNSSEINYKFEQIGVS